MSSRDLLLAEAVLGRDAEEFLSSELGRYLVGRAQMEGEEATEKLKRIAPWRRRRITELQAQVWRAESFRDWLAEMVTAGRAAESALEQQSE